jgi:signal transduction histidine kinase
MPRENSDEAPQASAAMQILIATMPASRTHRRAALAVALGLFIALLVGDFYAWIQLPRVDAFIPAVQSVLLIVNLVAAAFLFAQYSVMPQRAVLTIASGYLFVALILIPQTLTFPGAVTRAGLLGAGTQSAVWLYVFWHAGFAMSVFLYALLKDDDAAADVTDGSVARAIGVCLAAVAAAVVALTWLATAGEHLLPTLLQQGKPSGAAWPYVFGGVLLLAVTAFALLWIRRRTILDLWLLVTMFAILHDVARPIFLPVGRFSLGWYTIRISELVAASILAIVLIVEAMMLYARLARANVMLQRERNNKLINMEAMAASFSHEVKQPLTAIATNGSAALRFLAHKPANHEEVQAALHRIVEDAHRTGQIFDNLRMLFGRAGRSQAPIDVNDVVREALRNLRSDLNDHEIAAEAKLASELPLVMGHKGQLQEVISNLVSNAIEAMQIVKDGRRVLQVCTERQGDQVVVAVEDSGPGIDPRKLDSIFDPFVTTKSNGMGLGLAICRMIVDHHGGQLSALPARSRGAAFHMTLPIDASRKTVSEATQ